MRQKRLTSVQMQSKLGSRRQNACGFFHAKIWCIKTSTTERFAKLAYPGSIGAELEAARKEKTREATELALERTLTEAIAVNPRTEYVRDFEFEWDGDDVHVRFRVKGKNIEEFQIEL